MAYTPGNNNDFNDALTYYFNGVNNPSSIPGGVGNVTHANVMDIVNWQTQNVDDMSDAFSSSGRTNFNEDISGWNTSNVTDFTRMFKSCKFGQNIRKWNVSSSATLTNMFENSWILFSQEYILLENAWTSTNLNITFGPYGDSTKRGTPTHNFFNLTKPQLYYVKVDYQAGTTYQIDQSKINTWYTDILNNTGSWQNNTNHIIIQCDKLQFTEDVNWYHFLTIEIINSGIEIDGQDYTISIIKAPYSSGLQYRVQDYTSTTNQVYTAFNGLIRNGNKLLGLNGNGGTIKNIKLFLSGQGDGSTGAMTLNIYSGFLLQEYTNYNSTNNLLIENCLVKANNGFHIGAGGNEGFLPDRQDPKYFSNPNLAQHGGIAGRFLNSESTKIVEIKNCQSVVDIERSSSALVASYANYKSDGGKIKVNNTKAIVKNDRGGTYAGFFGQGCNGDAINGATIEINSCYTLLEDKSQNDSSTFADTYGAFFHSKTAVGADSSTVTEVKNSYSVRTDNHPNRIASIASSRSNSGKITVTNCFGSQTTHGVPAAIIADKDIALLSNGNINTLPSNNFLNSTTGNLSRYPRLKVFSLQPFNPMKNLYFSNESNFGSIPIFTPDGNIDFQAALNYYFDQSSNFITTATNNASTNSIEKHNTSNAAIIGFWDTKNVTTMSSLFSDPSRVTFNEDIGLWNTDNVTDLNSMFYGCTSFNQNVSTKYNYFSNSISWDVSGVTDKQQVFLNASAFNNGDPAGQSNNPLNWNIGEATNLQQMFSGATSFNQPIDFSDVIIDLPGGNTYQYKQWDVSGVEKMGQLFNGCTSFNQSISKWDTQKVEDMNEMFKGCTSFNQDLTTIYRTSATPAYISWNTEKVEEMYQFLMNATSFNNGESAGQSNKPLNWNINSVKASKFYGLFKNASSFNQSVDTSENEFNLGIGTYSWLSFDVSGIDDFNNMFNGASMFNQNVRDWEVDSGDNTNNMFKNTLIVSDDNYVYIPNGWVNLTEGTPNNVVFFSNIAPIFPAHNFTPADSLDFMNGIKYYFKQTNNLPNGTQNNATAETVGNYDNSYAISIERWDTKNVTDMSGTFNIQNGNLFNKNISTKLVNNKNLLPEVYDASGSGISNQGLNVPDWLSPPSNAIAYQSFVPSITGKLKNMSFNVSGFTNITQKNIDFKLWKAIPGTNGLPSFNSGSLVHNNVEIPPLVDTSFNRPAITHNSVNEVSDISINFQHSDAPELISDSTYVFYVSDAEYMMFSPSTGLPNLPNSVFFAVNNNTPISTVNISSGVLYFKNMISPYEKQLAWNTDNVTNFDSILKNASSFNNDNNPLQWSMNSANSVTAMFEGTSSFNQQLNPETIQFDISAGNTVIYNTWNMSNVQDMSGMFKNASNFNQPLIWQTDSVDNMRSMFEGASSFNQNLRYRLVNNNHVWNMENVKNIQDMFKDASSFNNGNSAFQWNILSISGNAMTGLFHGASSFNQNINTTSLVNPPIPLWDVSQVTHFSEIFHSATSFNNGRTTEVEPFNWNTEKAVEMSHMFHGASSFNQDVQDWFKQGKLLDMSNAQVPVTNNGLREMFHGASSFAAFAREWVIPNGISYEDIFNGATDMSNIFYPGRSDTSYNSTPGYNFFNYDVQNDPGLKYNISYPNYYEDNTFAIILPVTSDISGDAYIEIPYNLVFGNIDISSSTPTPNADTISVSSNVDINGAKNLNYTQDSNNENRTFLVDLPLKHNGNTLVTLPLEITVHYGFLPPPPTPPPPPQKSGREYACSNKKRHGCEAYMANSDKNGGLFSGNINQPNFMAVEAYKYSNLVNFSSRRQSMKTKYIPLQLNVFGRYQGAPGGSGMRLKNKF